MTRDILVVVEDRGGGVEPLDGQMLATGRLLADQAGGELMAAATGNRLDGVVDALQERGVDKVFVVDDPLLSRSGPELQAEVIAEVVRRANPCLVLIGYSLFGMELTPAIGAKMGVTALTNCLDIEFRDGAFVVTRPLFDNTRHATIVLEKSEISVVALQRGPVPSMATGRKQAQVLTIGMDLKSLPSRSRVLRILEDPISGVDISKADIVVAVGRGIGDKEKIALLEELADALGGVLACSRPVVDVGWLPRERQVGASGRSVAPKVYIACGISGAIQHLSGMRESKRIIAINKDPEAPMFQVAHYGVVGDLFEIVPALTEEAKKARGERKSPP